MLELLDFLRANDFKIYICSGGGIDFIRQVSDELYDIPKENVIGSSIKYYFEDLDIKRGEELGVINDKKEKPVNIFIHTGRRPILAFGNSNGDIQMLQFTQGNKLPNLSLLLHHDDEEREYKYDKGAEEALELAKANDWITVSIKNDFKSVF
jgi:hypothetical protein